MDTGDVLLLKIRTMAWQVTGVLFEKMPEAQQEAFRAAGRELFNAGRADMRRELTAGLVVENGLIVHDPGLGAPQPDDDEGFPDGPG